MFFDYLGLTAVGNPILGMVRNMFNSIKLADVVTTFSTGTATESVLALGQKMTSVGGLLESGMKMIFRLFLETLHPTDEKIDLLESNLR